MLTHRASRGACDMLKAASMKKAIVKQGVVAGAVVLVATGLIVGSGMLKSKAEQTKTAAESARSSNTGRLSSMQTQIQESGKAEEEFAIIAATHQSDDYSANSDTLKQWLRDAKDQYRLGDGFKLTLPLPTPSDKPELSALNYTVEVRSPVKLELDAMSDIHVYSFLDSMLRELPGLIRLSNFDLTQSTPMTEETARQMRMGLSPMLVRATLDFSWVGMEPKEEAATDAPPAGP